jgi:hypothetical protein
LSERSEDDEAPELARRDDHNTPTPMQ